MSAEAARARLRAEVAKSSINKVADRLGVTRWAVSRYIGDGAQIRSPELGPALAMERELGIPAGWWLETSAEQPEA